MSAWITVALAGIGSLAFRSGVTLVLGNRSLPGWFERASDDVVPACVAGRVAPVVLDSVVSRSSTALPLSVAGVVTVLASRRTSAQTAFLTGMTSLWISHALVVIGG